MTMLGVMGVEQNSSTYLCRVPEIYAGALLTLEKLRASTKAITVRSAATHVLDSARLYIMRGKRSKKYRKLMEQFSMSFGFREPYQVLVDGEMVLDSCRFKMELEPALSRTLHGTVKPMITQCEIRKLYARKDEPGVSEAIELAKTCERRRCGHHPEEYPEPLGTMDCLGSVVDPKDKGENKHRYVVASQSQDVRRMLRGIRGVPLIYIRRSVMILEPMSDESAQMRAREERGKFRAEIKTALGKRKREEKKDAHENGPRLAQAGNGDAAAGVADRPRNKKRGPKGPNPLSVKKSKKKTPANTKPVPKAEAPAEVPSKGKRRRKDDSGMGAANGEAQDARPTDAKAD